MKRLLLTFLALACAITISAQNKARGGTVYCAYYADPRSLNPLGAPEAASANFQNLMFNGLMRTNERREIVPDLAEKWEVSADGLTWTFTLREGVHFHDGGLLTAEDVVATYNWILNPLNFSPLRALYQSVKGFSADGPRIVKVVLKEPYGALPYTLQRSIVPARILKGGPASISDFSKRPVGTGPFKLVEWKAGGMVFEANESYFEGRPGLDRIVFRMFPDQRKAWAAFMQGEIDVVTDLDQEDYQIIEKDDRFKVYDLPGVFCYTLLFNLKDPLFSQPKIREAISKAIDRVDLTEKALAEAAIPTTGLFRPGTWSHSPDPSLQAYDPSEASRILADLGWKDTDGDWVLEKGKEELRFTVLLDQGDRFKEAATKRLQWQLLQVGVKLEVQVLPFLEMQQKRLAPGAFQAVFLQFNTAGDPDSSVAAFWHSSSIGRTNFGSYRSAEADRLIEQGRKTSEAVQRQAIYQKLDALLARDAPAVFLFYKKQYSAASARVSGIGKSVEFFSTSSVRDWYLTEQSR